MTKILGLDLGINSIGWAIVDDSANSILGMGSRIFPEGVKANSIGSGDREESRNAARRNSRQLRRQYYRKRLRKIKLLRTLIDLNMCPLTHQELDYWAKWDKTKGKAGRKAPSSKLYKDWLSLNPYELREKALHHDMTLFELGRVFYHIIQRRGFLSNRKGNDDGAIYKGKVGMTGINATHKQIEGKTLGSFLNSIYPKNGEPFKVITDENGNELRVRARYTLRDMYIEEFEKIWKRQEACLGLTDKTAVKRKVKFIKGSLASNRNKKIIKNLKDKYGHQNVFIEEIHTEIANKTFYKISSTQTVDLKTFLGGEIHYSEFGNIKHKSQDSVLFWQRPLRSQKGLLAKCRFEPDVKTDEGKYLQKGKTPCHISHPLFEEFRTWQFINNIEYGKKQKLDENQRYQVLELINSKDSSFKFSEIPTKLKMQYEKWNYGNEQAVAGNYTTKHLSSLFSKEIYETNKEDLWHCFHFFEDNDNLVQKLANDYGLQERDFKKIEKINLKEGYSNVSLKAIRNIIIYLRKGYQMSDATILGGVRNVFGNRWKYYSPFHEILEKDILKINHDKSNKEGDAIAKIKDYLIANDYGFSENDSRFIKLYHHSQEIEQRKLQEKLDAVENIRNPIVQQGVNETRRLVNQLIDVYGKFDRIQVELGRDIKNSKQGRQKMGIRINENTAKNDAARKLLTEYGLKHSRENIQKVLLYKEMQDRGVVTVCPYTNQSINIKDVLGKGNKIQIEHIIPKSVSLDDSFDNKTLCDAYFNGLKGNLTPYQFYLKNSNPELWGGAHTWDDIEKRVYRLLPYKKAKRFTSKIDITEAQVKSSFIERQLNDTRYISRKTKEIMSQVCEDVRVLPGGLTSELRHLWGLNNILQPVRNLELPVNNLDIDHVYPHYVVLDEENNPISTSPIYKEKPKLESNETTIVGLVEKGVFRTTEKFVKLSVDTPQLTNGEYWLKLKLSDPIQKVQIYKQKPRTSDSEIVLRGKIEKGKFKNDSIGVINSINLDNGMYWVKLPILKKTFIKPQKEVQPKKTGKQLLLYGLVDEGVFNSYIYECESDLPDGKYWLLLDLDTNSPSFERAINERPTSSNAQIIVEGSINKEGLFVSEIDVDHQMSTNEKEGKYWFVFDIINDLSDFTAIKEPVPSVLANQRLIEGNIWVDKYTGEIKFDPKKNRDDHRHHAIDALVIALSKQSYFQKLSIYNAQREAKKKGLAFDKEQLNFPEPWDRFHTMAKKEAEKILIAHKQNTKVLTEVRKRVSKNGKTYLSVGNSVRGQLHKENVYGQRQAPFETTKGYHIRKKVTDLKDNQINKIVDLEIRKIIMHAKQEEVRIKKQIETIEKLKRKAKTDEEEGELNAQINRLNLEIAALYTLKNRNGAAVPIKKVRIREEMSNAQPLNGQTQWVNPRNNHHVIIYKDENKELKEEVISFWEVVERLKQNEAIYQLPKTEPNALLITTLQENDMFLLGLSDEEFEENIMNKKFVSSNLYRVQKLSKKKNSFEFFFRHHLASNLNNENEGVSIQSFKKWQLLNPIKVKVLETGVLEIV